MNHNFLFTYNDPKMRKYLVVHFRTYLNSIKIKNVTFFITLFIPYFLFVYLHSLPLSLSLSLSIFSVPLHLYPSLSLSLSVLPLIQELLKKENMINLIYHGTGTVVHLLLLNVSMNRYMRLSVTSKNRQLSIKVAQK